jgi:hypothetical protein
MRWPTGNLNCDLELLRPSLGAKLVFCNMSHIGHQTSLFEQTPGQCAAFTMSPTVHASMYVDKLDGKADAAFFDRMSAAWRPSRIGVSAKSSGIRPPIDPTKKASGRSNSGGMRSDCSRSKSRAKNVGFSIS